MKNQEWSGILLRFFRSVVLIDPSLAIIVWLISYVFGWRTPEAYGTVIIWAGIAVSLFASLAGIGGLSSRAEDAEAFSLSGSGNMSENFRRIAECSAEFSGLLHPAGGFRGWAVDIGISDSDHSHPIWILN